MDDFNNLITSLKYSPYFLEKLIENNTPENLKNKKIKDRWSAHEHACHVCVGEKFGFHKRFLLFQTKESPRIEPLSGANFPKDFYLTMKLDECLIEFKLLREKTIDLITHCSPEFWEKKAFHPEYIKYTPLIMLRHLLMHDYFHFYKIEELLLTNDEYL